MSSWMKVAAHIVPPVCIAEHLTMCLLMNVFSHNTSLTPPLASLSFHLSFQRLYGVLQFGVTVAYLLVAYCYFGVAYTGYHAFGNSAGDQILYSLGHPVWVVCTASVMVIVHVCGSFQVHCCLYAVHLLYVLSLSSPVYSSSVLLQQNHNAGTGPLCLD